MTVPSTTRRAGPYLGNGVTTSFPFTFKVFARTDIAFTLTNASGISTSLVLDSDYSVTLNVDQDSSPGGTITYPISGSPMATGYTLVGVGALPYDQQTSFPDGGAYRASTTEDTFDRTEFQIQQLAEAQGRALTLPASASSANTELPVPTASNLIGWNEAADALVNYTPESLATVVVAGTSYFNVFNGDGATTVFTLTADPGSVNALDIAVNGVPQKNGIDFTVSGTTLTFIDAPSAGTQNVAVRYVAAVPVGSANAQDVGFYPNDSQPSRSVEVTLRQDPTIYHWMTSVERDDVLSGAHSVDVTTAVQRAIDWAYANGRSLRYPSGGALVGQITTYPTTTIKGGGRHVANWWCKAGTTGKWWSDRGGGAQKLTLGDMAFYGQNEAGLTHVAEFGDVGTQYGTEGNLSRLWFRDAPNAYGLLVDGNVGLMKDITIQSVQNGLKVKGSYNHGSDIIIVATSGTAFDVSSGHWHRVEVEAPTSGSTPVNINDPGTHISGLTVSLATGTSFTRAIEIASAAVNEWSVNGLKVILNGTASLTNRFRQNGVVWDGVQGDNTGQLAATALTVGVTPHAVPLLGVLKVVAALDFPSVATGAAATLDVTVNGAVANMPAVIGFPVAGPFTGLQYTAYCPAANTVRVRAYNPTAGAIDPPSQTFVLMAFAYA